MKLKKFIPIIIFIFLFAIGLVAKTDEFIEWKTIKGAYGYVIEIRNADKKVILEKKVKENLFPIELPKGKYDLRVAPLNVFKKPAVWSHWHPLEIIISRKPVVGLEEPILLIKEDSLQPVVEIFGDNFLENTKVEIIRKGKKIPIKETKLENSRLLVLKLNLNTVFPGKYHLVLKNPNKKVTTKKEFVIVQDVRDSLVIKNNLRPVITLSEPIVGYYQTKLQKIELRGENFQDDTKIKFIGKDGMALPIEGKEVKSPEVLSVDLNLENAKIGTYDLVLKNPSTKRVRKPDFLIIKPKELVIRSESPVILELGSAPTQKIEIKGENFLPETSVSIYSNAGTLSVLNKSFESDKKLIVEVKLRRARPGKYHLTLINPNNEQITKKDFLEIQEEQIVIKEPPDHGDITKYELAEMYGYLRGLKKSCASSELPDIIIDKCYEGHIALNLSTTLKKNVYNFIRMLDKENLQARLESYHYFSYNCSSKMRAVKEYIEQKLNKPNPIYESFEKRYMQFTIKQQDACEK